MTERRQGHSALHYFRCQSCGYNGPITEAEIAKHRSLCATGTTEPIATGVQLITAERQRQIEVEGWTPEHDDEHLCGSLAEAAVCYAATEPLYRMRDKGNSGIAKGIVFEDPWPFDWDTSWDKREHDASGRPRYCQFPIPRRIRDLVKAGALIAAEIDRLQRRQP